MDRIMTYILQSAYNLIKESYMKLGRCLLKQCRTAAQARRKFNGIYNSTKIRLKYTIPNIGKTNCSPGLSKFDTFNDEKNSIMCVILKILCDIYLEYN